MREEGREARRTAEQDELTNNLRLKRSHPLLLARTPSPGIVW